MARYVVLLRAVNVGDRKLAMASLRTALGRAGGNAPETVGISGNAVVEFDPGAPPSRLEPLIEAAVASVSGLRTEAFVRTSAEWDAIVRANPFPREAHDDPAHLVVTTLRGTPSPGTWKELDRSIVGRERVAPGDRVAYVVYPDGIGRSKLTLDLIERKLGVRGTSRNWNTTLQLRGLLEG
jgi:uncharacterized protein (DUF1697 family)